MRQLSSPAFKRTLHTSPPLLQKRKREDRDNGGKEKRAEGREKQQGKPAETQAGATQSSQHPTPSSEEPLDFADVKSRMAKNEEHARDALKKLRAGGRFNPDLVGALRVQPDRKEGASFPLRELAQVVPKGGRSISILVHEEAYVKPIMSAIQASKDFNQQPQRDPDNELELLLKIEVERREDVVKRIKAVCHEWRERVRSVRQKRDKLHATWKKDNLIGPDLKRKVDVELDKIIKAKITEIDAAEKEVMKATEAK